MGRVMTSTSELTPQIRAVLERQAPAATPHDLDRYAQSIAWHYVITSAGRLAGSRRGTAPALKNLAAVHRKILSLAEAIARLGPDETAALQNSSSVPTRAAILEGLATLNEHILSAYRRLEREPERPTRQGRPPGNVISETTDYVAKVYEWLAGQLPRRSTDRDSGAPGGDFDAFLSGIFNVLGIEANTEYRIRHLSPEKSRKLR